MILDQFKLDGKIAMVTGASRGLGQAMALGLAEAGADIACVSRSGDDAETRGRVEQVGRKFLGLKADLARPGERDGLVDKVVAHFGQIDILVNNAGSGTRHPPELFPMHEWLETLEVHLHSAFDLSQQAAHHMLPRASGKIINIGSIMCWEAGLNISAYAAAKHGIAGLTKSLAVSWAKKGINVNCIAPGYFVTNLATTLKNDPVRGPQILERIPMGRWGSPPELAGLCVFLASEASNYMHGSIVAIDGGWLSR
ncbi:MAG: SDR family oxidoreductase [Gemmataceae bacterium]